MFRAHARTHAHTCMYNMFSYNSNTFELKFKT